MCVTKRRNSDDCQIKLNYHNRFILKLLRHYFILGVVLVVRFINMNTSGIRCLALSITSLTTRDSLVKKKKNWLFNFKKYCKKNGSIHVPP